MKNIFLRTLTLLAIAAIASAVEENKPPAFPEAAGPFMGDWSGQWLSGEEKHPEIAAQIIALGGNAYQIVLLPTLYARVPPFAVLHAVASEDALRFDNSVYFGEISGGKFTGGRRGEDAGVFELKPYALVSPTMGAPAPPEALRLFDGTSLDHWEQVRAKNAWDILENGILQANPATPYLESKHQFRDCRLHLEFRTPFLPEEREQDRGNSGVFLQHYYEIQILDSYGLPGYWNDCGSIYRISAPYVNMCLPPLQWQTYDIEFRGARFGEQGELLEKARITVLHNGVAVQKDHEIPRGTSGDAKKPPVPPPAVPGALRLQSHKNHVQFRNIWVVDLDDPKQ